MVKWWIFGLMIIATLLGAYGALFLKKGAKKFNIKIFSQIKNYNLILGVFLYGCSSVFAIAALKYENVSIIYPMTSLSYIWVAMISKKHLNESINKFKWIGIGLIIIGITFITNRI